MLVPMTAQSDSSPPPTASPFPFVVRLFETAVQPEWIDYNGHMNVACYLLAFDKATDALLDELGLGRAYAEAEGSSIFVVEAHLTYAREVTEGDRLSFDSWLMGVDEKRIHLIHEMRHAEDGFLAATAELMLIHVDLAQRRAVALPPDRKAAFSQLGQRAGAQKAGEATGHVPVAGRSIRQL